MSNDKLHSVISRNYTNLRVVLQLTTVSQFYTSYVSLKLFLMTVGININAEINTISNSMCVEITRVNVDVKAIINRIRKHYIFKKETLYI